MCASAGRPPAAKNARRAPNLVARGGGFTRIIASGEIMRSDKERVVVNHLGARRIVVRVIKTYQSVPQEGSKQGLRLVQCRVAAGGLDDFYQIGSHLQGSVTIAVEPRGKLGPLTLRKKRLRHLKFPKLPCKWEQRVGDFLPLGHLVQAIAQRDQRIQGNQT